RDHVRAWIEMGVLVQDRDPTLYVHRHTFRPPGEGGPRERLGCFAAVEPVPHERGEVLRHELTMTAPKADRLKLLQVARTQTSPVFLLYQGCPEVTRELEAAAAGALPFAEAVVEGDHGAERHQLWRVSDPVTVARVGGSLSQARLFIADGHHRYETALNLKLPGMLALLSPLDDPGNVILPTHRVVPNAALTPGEIGASLVARGWQSEPAGGVPAALDRIQQLRDPAHAFAVLGGSGCTVLWRARDAAGELDPLARLDVTVLEKEILEPLLGMSTSSAASGGLIYTRDAGEALRLSQDRQGVGFLLNSTTVAEMAAVATAGEAMPQKSTYFFPKVPAGLVLMSVDQAALDPPA
ncbi:MAG TPA: DUF1015 domain-containing protein, partial [Candidatus Dormibacteraeota bacterium]